MMKFALTLLVVASLAALSQAKDRNNKPYKVVCYWGSWSFYRPEPGKFAAENANPNICTHMIYGFTKLNADNTIGIFDPDLDTGDTNWNSGLQWGRGMYRRWNYLRTVNPHMSTLIAIGGWNEGSDKYSRMVSSPASRRVFVDSVVKFLQKHNFDGLDVDWEYPAMKAAGDADRKPGVDADKENYIELLKELKEAFEPHGYLLTAAVSAGKPTIDRAYNVPEMSKYLDIINLMTYDFHGGWENRTAHNAPLHARPEDTGLDKEFTVEYAVNYWLELGADPKKIVMGIPLYGRTFTLANPSNFGIGAAAVGAGGAAGPITRLVGTLGYNEICQNLKSDSCKVHRDEAQKIPYAVCQNQWYGFDDEESIKEKVNFLKSKGLGGGMVWSIDTDDFKGLCGKGKYPLLKTISRELNGVDGPDVDIPETHVTPTSTPGSVTQPHNPQTKETKRPPQTKPTREPVQPTDAPVTKPVTQSPPGGDFKCSGGGFFPDPKDKTVFHECVNNGGGKFQDIVYHCGPGTVYDEANRVCKHPSQL